MPKVGHQATYQFGPLLLQILHPGLDANDF